MGRKLNQVTWFFPPSQNRFPEKKKPDIVQPHLYIRPHILEPKLENRDSISSSQLRTQMTKGKLLTGSITENGQATKQGQRWKKSLPGDPRKAQRDAGYRKQKPNNKAEPAQ
jgi:hypothetical protein